MRKRSVNLEVLAFPKSRIVSIIEPSHPCRNAGVAFDPLRTGGMQLVVNGVPRCLTILALTWSTLGLATDVLSGPLTPEAFLQILLDAPRGRVSERNHQPPHWAGLANVDVDAERSTESEGSVPSPAVVCDAAWPALMAPSMIRRHGATGFRIALSATHVDHAPPPPSQRLHTDSVSDHPQDTIVQFCRLLC